LPITRLLISPTSIQSGASATGTITLPIALGADTVIKLSTSANVVTLPATVTMPAGSTTVSFTVVGKKVTAATPATVTATLGASTASATITIKPAS